MFLPFASLVGMLILIAGLSLVVLSLLQLEVNLACLGGVLTLTGAVLGREFILSLPKRWRAKRDDDGEERPLFEAEDETRHYKWQLGRAELDPVAGTITIYGKPPITVPVSEIASCEIVQREDIGPLRRASEASVGSGDLGCALLLWPIVTIEDFIAKNTMVPVIRLIHSTSDDSGQGWVIHLRSKRRGRRGRAATFEMAHRIVAFLSQNGYSGPMPDLRSEGAVGTVDQIEVDRAQVGCAYLAGITLGAIVGSVGALLVVVVPAELGVYGPLGSPGYSFAFSWWPIFGGAVLGGIIAGVLFRS